MDSEKEQHSEEFFKKLIKTQLKEKVLKAKISFDGRNFLIRLPKKLTETLNWTKENNKDFEAEFYAHTIAHKKSVLVDLSGLTFLSSMGIRMFLKAAKDLRAEGKKIILLNMQPLAEKALKAAGLDFLTPVAHDISQAKDMLKSP